MARAAESDRCAAMRRHVGNLLTNTLSAVYSPGRQKMAASRERTMRSGWGRGAAIAFAIGGATTAAGAGEIRLAQQFSMGYLQFNVMKRDRLIEKYAAQRGLQDFKRSVPR